jgi:hypothetical protein
VTRGEGEQRRGPRATRSRKLGLLLGLALLAGLVLSVGAASADTPPSVTIAAPTAVSYTSVHVSGTVNPEGGPSAADWWFEYSTEPADPNSWVFSTATGEITGTEAEGTSPIPVEGTMEGLAPGTTYSVRLVAFNEEFANTGETEAPYPSLTTLAVAGPAVSLDPVATFTGTTAHLSGAINPGGTDPAFNVEWHFECTPTCPGLNPGTIPADNSSHPVEADVMGLLPGTSYEVSLVANNVGETVTAGPQSFATPTIVPQIASVRAVPLVTEVNFEAQINPGGLPTTYHFEYGPTASYGSSTVSKSISSGGTAVPVRTNVAGLAPGTTYHFRLFAENTAGPVEGVDQTFTTSSQGGAESAGCPNEAFRQEFGMAFLPDCRAYEQVSPIDKNGGEVSSTYFPSVSSESGDGLVFGSSVAFGGATSGSWQAYYLARRSAGGWSSESISPPLRANAFQLLQHPYFAGYSGELDRSVLVASESTAVPGAPEGVPDIYLRDNSDRSYQLLTSKGPEFFNPFYTPTVAATSADARDVLFESELALTPGATAGVPNVYGWVDGELRLESILPGGAPVTDGAVAGLGPGSGDESNLTNRAMSSDGSRVFFTDRGDGQIYLRQDGSSTIQISASQRNPAEAQQPARFLTATPDGSKAFFTSPERLTEDATGDPSGSGFEDLYMYDVGRGELTDLSIDHEAGDPQGAAVEGVLGVSDDGDYVYFAATGHLAPGGGPGGGNIYLWHDGTASYVGQSNYIPNWTPALTRHTLARTVTPDGHQLIFTSGLQLTSYDNEGNREVYLYTAGTGSPVCISCDPSGAAPHGDASLESSPHLFYLDVKLAQHEIRTISRDGSRVFFGSPDPLSSADTNGKMDVYEWSAGKARLISSGSGNYGSYLLDASEDGSDVFFITGQRLVGQDEDELTDVYDARVEGGLTSQFPPASSVACQGEACRGSADEQADAITPASSAVSGPTNLKKPRQQRQTHKKKHHHKKKHKKKKGHKPTMDKKKNRSRASRSNGRAGR